MSCEPAGGAGQAAIHLHPSGQAQPDAVDHDHVAHEHGTTGEHANSGSAPDKCNLCCDLCSLTPLLSSLPTVPLPQAVAAISFPDLFAPSPSYLTERQDRPPRSI
ncbi:hypothetical protein [Variovorax humicola]|uniref:hypothetical protein n=1 Tax=Variovorax humicola TaxID=1769758 RepID=UPI003BF60E63